VKTRLMCADPNSERAEELEPRYEGRLWALTSGLRAPTPKRVDKAIAAAQSSARLVVEQ
jgi:hypothetical protein